MFCEYDSMESPRREFGFSCQAEISDSAEGQTMHICLGPCYCYCWSLLLLFIEGWPKLICLGPQSRGTTMVDAAMMMLWSVRMLLWWCGGIAIWLLYISYHLRDYNWIIFSYSWINISSYSCIISSYRWINIFSYSQEPYLDSRPKAQNRSSLEQDWPWWWTWPLVLVTMIKMN